MPYTYKFDRSLDSNGVANLAKAYKWFLDVSVDGNTIVSQRPMPPHLYRILKQYCETDHTLLYERCREVYERVLKQGEECFPEVGNLIVEYGDVAKLVFLETIDEKEIRKRLRKNSFENLLMFVRRGLVQWPLFTE